MEAPLKGASFYVVIASKAKQSSLNISINEPLHFQLSPRRDPGPRVCVADVDINLSLLQRQGAPVVHSLYTTSLDERGRGGG